MSKVADLQAQIAALQAQVEQAQKEEQKDAIATCRNLIAQFALTPEQLFGKRGPKKAVGVSQAPALYKDPNSDKTWSGRGRAPKWIVGQNYGDFRI